MDLVKRLLILMTGNFAERLMSVFLTVRAESGSPKHDIAALRLMHRRMFFASLRF